MADTSIEMKVIDWDNQPLPFGRWEVSRKIDGVRCHNEAHGKVSRKNKPLYNIPDFIGEVAEIYCGSFKLSHSNTSTFKTAKEILPEHVYHLRPIIDPRLFVEVVEGELSPEQINNYYLKAREEGFEGIVIRNLDTDEAYRKKPYQTTDTIIIGFVDGKSASTKGLIASFVTPYGNVNAKTNELRRSNREALLGKHIEVAHMEFTPDGKFRQPRFERFRPDKD